MKYILITLLSIFSLTGLYSQQDTIPYCMKSYSTGQYDIVQMDVYNTDSLASFQMFFQFEGELETVFIQQNMNAVTAHTIVDSANNWGYVGVAGYTSIAGPMNVQEPTLFVLVFQNLDTIILRKPQTEFTNIYINDTVPKYTIAQEEVIDTCAFQSEALVVPNSDTINYCIFNDIFYIDPTNVNGFEYKFLIDNTWLGVESTNNFISGWKSDTLFIYWFQFEEFELAPIEFQGGNPKIVEAKVFTRENGFPISYLPTKKCILTNTTNIKKEELIQYPNPSNGDVHFNQTGLYMFYNSQGQLITAGRYEGQPIKLNPGFYYWEKSTGEKGKVIVY